MRFAPLALARVTLTFAALMACSPRERASDSSAPNEPAPSAANVGAAATPATRPETTPANRVTRPAADDAERSALDSLERAARAIVRTDGCTGADQCRTAPLGARGCGGPRDYVVYCARSTDTVALFRALGVLERAEKAYNAKHGVISTCELRLAPQPDLVAGRCSAGVAGGGSVPR